MLGIPYAPHKDPWVVLKKEYLDHTARNNNIAGALMKNATHGTSLMRQGLSVQQQSLTGQTWYDQSAMRAVNQVSKIQIQLMRKLFLSIRRWGVLSDIRMIGVLCSF